MGEVFLAHDARLDRNVAIKRLMGPSAGSPNRRARFRREAAVTARLRHPGIVEVFEVGEAGGHAFYAMELVHGETVHQCLARLCRQGSESGELDLGLTVLVAAVEGDEGERVLLLWTVGGAQELHADGVGVEVDGSLQIADFVNPVGLQPIGENMYIETAASGAAQPGTPGQNGLGSLNQGALEGSNVNVVSELVNMIETQRAYEMNSKAISTNDQMLQYINNNL